MMIVVLDKIILLPALVLCVIIVVSTHLYGKSLFSINCAIGWLLRCFSFKCAPLWASLKLKKTDLNLSAVGL
jgi:hypothetical protein